MIVKAVAELLGAILSAERCAACDASVPFRTVFCGPCAASVEPASQGGDVVAPFLYGGAVARAITRFKYEGRADLARPLSDLLARCVGQVGAGPDDVTVPVPLHPNRLTERGFNQAALLARAFARRSGARVAPRALERLRDTAQQASLDRVARASNVMDAFRVRTPSVVAGRHVVLVDDVCTTGATLDACARALGDAGAARVTRAVLARVE